MYKKSSRIISSNEEISNYIDGYDVYNSELIQLLSDPNLEKESYEITIGEYRPDIIAEEFYGSNKYSGLVVLQCNLSLNSFTRGTILKLVPKSTLDTLLSTL